MKKKRLLKKIADVRTDDLAVNLVPYKNGRFVRGVVCVDPTSNRVLMLAVNENGSFYIAKNGSIARNWKKLNQEVDVIYIDRRLRPEFGLVPMRARIVEEIRKLWGEWLEYEPVEYKP